MGKTEFPADRADHVADDVVRLFLGQRIDQQMREARRRRFLEHILYQAWERPLVLGGDSADETVESSDWHNFEMWLTGRFHACCELTLIDGFDVNAALRAAARYKVQMLGFPALQLERLLDEIGYTGSTQQRAIDPIRPMIERAFGFHPKATAVAYQVNVEIAIARAMRRAEARSQRPKDYARLDLLKRAFSQLRHDVHAQSRAAKLEEMIFDLEESLTLGTGPDDLGYVDAEKVRKTITRPRASDQAHEAKLTRKTGLSLHARSVALVRLFQSYESACRVGLIRWRAGCLIGDHNRVRRHRNLSSIEYLDGHAVRCGTPPVIAGGWTRSDFDLDTAEAISAAAAEVDQSNWRELLFSRPSDAEQPRSYLLIEEFDVQTAGEPGFRPLSDNEKLAMKSDGRDGIRRLRREAKIRACG